VWASHGLATNQKEAYGQSIRTLRFLFWLKREVVPSLSIDVPIYQPLRLIRAGHVLNSNCHRRSEKGGMHARRKAISRF
jgi:hypothetical protein